MKRLESIQKQISFRLIFYICNFVFIFCLLVSIYDINDWIGNNFPGFMVYSNRVVGEETLDTWTGNRNGIVSFDKILAVDGKKINSSPEMYEYVAGTSAGTNIEYTILRAGKVTNVEVPSMEFDRTDFIKLFAPLFLLGSIVFLVGFFVYNSKPGLLQARVFYLFCFIFGLWVTTTFDSHTNYILDIETNLFMLVAPFFIMLSLVFPSESRLFRNHGSKIIAGSFLISLLLIATQNVFSSNTQVWSHVVLGSWFYILLSTIVLVVSLFVSYFRSQNTLDKHRSFIVLIGSFLGFVIPSGLAIITVLFNYSNITYLILFVGFFPISIAYAIVKHKLFDIHVIIQKTIVYSITTAAVAGLFIFSFFGLNLVLSHEIKLSSPFYLLLLSAVVVIAINPLKNLVQNIVDVSFFRNKYDYERSVSEFSDSLPSLLNVREISRHLMHTVNKTLFNDCGYLFICDRESGLYENCFSFQNGTLEKKNMRLDEEQPLFNYLYMHKKEIFREDILTLDDYNKSRDELIKLFDEMNASIVFPLFFKDDLLGLLFLGGKKSGQMYSTEDVNFIKTIVSQTAISIKNSFSFELVEDYADELENKNKVLKNIQEQLIHTEKMSAIGQLAAGIAHEIRNPLNIIEGARYYLSTQLENGDENSTVTDYLEYIQNEVIRTNRLIDQLLNFAKIDQGQSEDVDINSIIENVLVLSRKQIHDAGVKLTKQLGENLPTVKGDSGQLWQVLINLLMNSIQSVDKEGKINIESGILENYFNSGSGYVYTKITDNGSGIDDFDMPRVFDPFFTKKASGTGLGLSVSYKIIESHKGNILVSSKLGEGTSFILQLPMDNGIQG